MATIDTDGTFKERFDYILLTILFLVASIFCFINGVEFINLRKNDPDGELEINTSYTIFLIVMNFLFAAITLFFTVLFLQKSVNPRGQDWADKIIRRFKKFTRNLEANKLSLDQEFKNRYEPELKDYYAGKKKYGDGPCDGIRGPKIIYSKPSDKETVLPVLNDPIKRFSLGDFLPISATRQREAEALLSPPKPITLDNLKSVYLSRKNI